MAKTVRVTPTQVEAAKLMVKRSVTTGRHVSPSVTAIANARKAHDGVLDGGRQRANQAVRPRG